MILVCKVNKQETGSEPEEGVEKRSIGEVNPRKGKRRKSEEGDV